MDKTIDILTAIANNYNKDSKEYQALKVAIKRLKATEINSSTSSINVQPVEITYSSQETSLILYNQRRQIEKKILPEYYQGIKTRRKMYELRADEDDVKPGDILVLREWDGEKYTGSKTRREVTSVLRHASKYGLMEGYCILSLQVPGWGHLRPSATLDNGE